MTREERHALLLKHGGEQIFAEMRERVRIAPEPSDEVVEKLRRIFAGRGSAVPDNRLSAPPASGPAADAA